MTNWETESLRASVFGDVPNMSLPDFKALTGNLPSQVVNAPATGLTQETGLYKGFTVVAVRAQDRADLFLLPQDVAATTPPTIGALPAVLDELEKLATLWLKDNTRDATRLALGVSLAINAPTLPDAQKLLLAQLPNYANDQNSIQDFSLQINRPRTLTSIAGLRVNRLTRWTVAINMVIPVGVQIMGQPPQVPRAQLEMDLNTPPGSVIPRAQIVPVFGELMKLADEIAVKGDIP